MEKNTSTAYVETTGPLAGALAPTGESGTPLFLINLCASMAPVALTSKTLPGLEQYRLYQVTRVEDGRTRYRLRLGFFATEAEAEEVLVKVREQYPTAFTACLCEEDKRFTRGYVVPTPAPKPQISIVPPPATPAPKNSAAAQPTRAQSAAPTKPARAATATPPAAATSTTSQIKAAAIADITSLDDLSWEGPPQVLTAPPAKQPASTPQPTATAPATKAPAPKAAPAAKAPAPAPKSEPKTATKIDPAASAKVKALDLTLSDPPPPPKPQATRPSNQPFHVGKGVDIPTTQLSLQSEPSAPTPATQPATATKIAASAHAPARIMTPTKPAVSTPAPAAKAATPAAPSKPIEARHPDLDSTQTIRALTAEELSDEGKEKWFAIQLAASEQPVNLDAMPRLDIFEAYRLYSVATAGSGKIIHSLRLGFFKEEVSAEAVAGYLKTFFSSPTVLRISVAEQARFKDSTLPKRPEPESKPQANVVELSAARTSRAAAVPTVTMEVVPGDTSATGSFKPNSTGSFRTSDTAKHRTLTPAKPAAKTAPPATKRSAPIARKKTGTSGKYKSLQKKSLAEELLEEAKEVELSESGIFRLQKSESSLLARLVDKLKK